MPDASDRPYLGGLAPYIGGKRRLAAQIVARLEAMPHTCYAEPFVGMGGVFFRRPTPSPVEVINDRSRDVATLFRVLQRHYVPLVDMMRWQLTTRAEFERLTHTDPETLTDLERAARFYYLQRTAFGGKVTGRSFGVSPTSGARFDITRLIPELELFHARLAGVTIECLDFAEFIARYDRPTTLYYLDPPYSGSEHDYGKTLFAPPDLARLADILRDVKGTFLLSLNDVPLVRELFAGFTLEPVTTTYSVKRGVATPARELLITRGR